MSEKINLKIFLKTFIFFPFFMVCVFSPLMISIVLTSFLPNGRYFATKLYEFFGWVGLKFVGINLIVEGAEKIDDNKSYVVVSNHPSTLDIFTHITALPVSIRFLTKSELFRIPIFGRVLKVLGLPRIDRENASANFDKINYSIERVLENKNSIMVFPEGKRSNQKDLLPFKKGAAYISKDFNLPIIPVVSHNAHNLMVKGKVWLKSGDVQIEILDPIYNVNDYTVEELTSKLESIIKEKLLV
jgi:1-acyl-sn-glycerol-3-phosphate acyltransferase